MNKVSSIIEHLEKEVENAKILVKKNKEELWKAKKKTILLHKEQGWPVESIKVATENILKSYRIARAVYHGGDFIGTHGGDFIGTHCQKTLASCDDILITIT